MDYLICWLSNLGIEGSNAVWAARTLLFILMVALAWTANLIAKRIILNTISILIKGTKFQWDDILIKRDVFVRISHLAPAIVVYYMTVIVFIDWPRAITGVQTAAQIYMVFMGLLIVDAFLNAFVDIYRSFDLARKMPIRGFVQVVKIVLYSVIAIATIAAALGKDPKGLLGGLGAMTAILMLIFKDSILGFVAGIQLTTNRMVKIGDWIEIPKFNADGDVIDISLTTVKVQNWDKTISMIPTYALVSDTFKNWQGMSEAGGRRIKRSIALDMTSIRFCDQTMIDKFKRFQYLGAYIDSRLQEITEFNKQQNIDESLMVNGRRLTNIGTFRAYIVAYLRNHPKIHRNMTFLVRQLPPSEKGLPMEIYVFSNDTAWVNYEDIQSDIFDHILAVIPEFELRVFQNPNGADFKHAFMKI